MVGDDRAHPSRLDGRRARLARRPPPWRRGRRAAGPGRPASGRSPRRRTRARRSCGHHVWVPLRSSPVVRGPGAAASAGPVAALGRLPARRQREHEPVAAAGPRRVDEVAALKAEQVARDGEVERVAPGHGSRPASNSPSTASPGISVRRPRSRSPRRGPRARVTGASRVPPASRARPSPTPGPRAAPGGDGRARPTSGGHPARPRSPRPPQTGARTGRGISDEPGDRHRRPSGEPAPDQPLEGRDRVHRAGRGLVEHRPGRARRRGRGPGGSPGSRRPG